MCAHGMHGVELLAEIEDPRSEEDLARYFGTANPDDQFSAFTGGDFEKLGGGGDNEDVADRFTAQDIVAVSMLGVHVPGRAARDLLQGRLGEALSAQLRSIPAQTDLVEAPLGDVDHGSAAERAWKLLVAPENKGVNWVIASKLLARKRPRLLPVYDQVVKCALHWPGTSFWVPLRSELQANGRVLHNRLKRMGAALPTEVSPLRVLDVVLWMRHEKEHFANLRATGDCPGLPPRLATKEC
ncbi:DUF6308 family protein [Streptomyces sp. NPDC058691]|uniref:DUF6308 family protein n=1 Tax=Streptomyces sp. NPDC058691 TaxID=3346601 RepID=UPI003654F172